MVFSGSPYRTPISSAILQLQEAGQLHVLKAKWWTQQRGGGQCQVSFQKWSTKNNYNSLKICNTSKNMVVNMVLCNAQWPIYFTSSEFMQYGKDLPFEKIYWNSIGKWWMEGCILLYFHCNNTKYVIVILISSCTRTIHIHIGCLISLQLHKSVLCDTFWLSKFVLW